MSIGNITLQELLKSEGLEKVQSDFLSDLSNENWGEKTLKEVLEDYGAGYHTLRQFYKGNQKSEGYVKDFLQLIMKLSESEYSEVREDKNMREYQLKFILDTLKFIQNSKNNAGYIHSATSTGKTVVFGEVARQICEIHPDGNILVVVSGSEAQTRAKKEFDELGISVGLYNKDNKNTDERVTIITRQSLIRTGIENIYPESISLMICDEIHDGFLGPKSREVLGRFPCKKIGYTATPELRNKHVEEIFGERIGEYLIDEAQRDGYLPQINSDHSIELDDIFFENLEIRGDDYTEESLGKLQIDHVFPKILEFFQNGAGKGKQFALFMPSVPSSKRLQEYMSKRGISIAHVDGDTKNMTDVKNDFESRKIQIITSCEKMTQSWDSDVIDGVMNLRPTLSPSKYFQILGRALHGKQFVDGQKLPKDEIMMVDLVNEKESFRNRSITASGIKEVLTQRKELGEASRNRERVEKISPRIIRELQMYYEFDLDIDESSIKSILDEFRAKIGVEKSDFYNNLHKDVSHYDTETEELIDVRLISNSALGKSYSGRIRDISVSLGVFLKLVKDIHDIEAKDYVDMSKYDIEFYMSKAFLFDLRTPQSENIEGITFLEHIRHIYKNLFTDLDRKWVGDFEIGDKIPRAIYLRIVKRFCIGYTRGIGGTELKNKNIDFELRASYANGIRFYGESIYLGDINIAKIRQGAMTRLSINGATRVYSIYQCISECEIGSLVSRGVDLQQSGKFSDTDVRNIVEAFYETAGYKIIDELEEEQVKLTLEDLLENMFGKLSANWFIGDMNMSIVREAGKVIVDMSYLHVPDKVNLHVSRGKAYEPISCSGVRFIAILKKIIEEGDFKISRELQDTIRNFASDNSNAHKNLLEFGEFRGKGSDVNELESCFRKIFNRLGVYTIGKQENKKAQKFLRDDIQIERPSSISGDIGVHQAAMKELIGLQFNLELGEYTYDSSKIDVLMLQSFVTMHIATKNEFIDNVSVKLRRRIFDGAGIHHESSKQELLEVLEEVFDYIDLPLRDIHKYPLTLEGVREKLFSGSWNDLLDASNSSNGGFATFSDIVSTTNVQIKQILGDELGDSSSESQEYFDFSRIKTPKDDYYREWLERLLQYMLESFDDEVKEVLPIFHRKSIFKSADLILTTFCEVYSIQYINNKRFKNQVDYIVQPEYLITDEGRKLLTELGVLFQDELKAYDTRGVKSITKVKVLGMGGQTFFKKFFEAMSDEDKQEISQRLGDELTGIKRHEDLRAIVDFYFEKAGWEKRYLVD